MFQNVVVGTSLVPPMDVFAFDENDWENNEKSQTLFTDTRFLPAIMKEAGIVNSTGEVRRNKPELVITLDAPDFLIIKWGKKFLHILVGGKEC